MKKQLSRLPKMKDVFVGPTRGTNAKSHRPLDNRRPLHICMRSRFAKGKRTMLGVNAGVIREIVSDSSKRHGVKVVRFANVGNHLHLVVKLPGSAMTARRQYSKWIRILTSRIAFIVGGSKKGAPLLDEKGERAKFWDSLPFSRVVHGRRGWRVLDRYVLKNELESQGMTAEYAFVISRELYDSSRLDELAVWSETG